MQEKLLTSELFKDKKDSYPSSVSVQFKNDRLTENSFYKNLPSPKTEIFKTKSFLINQSEKILVN